MYLQVKNTNVHSCCVDNEHVVLYIRMYLLYTVYNIILVSLYMIVSYKQSGTDNI